MSLIYLFYHNGRQSIAPVFWKILAFSGALIWICFGCFLSSIVKASVYLSMEDGSLGERYAAWLGALAVFRDHPLFGAGFSAFSQLHNMYLALFFELGLFGAALFALTAAVFWFCSKGWEKVSLHLEKEKRFVQGVKKLGLIHVFWFAASNHNLHHHLTWLVFFIGFSSLVLSQKMLREETC
ncbi:MAG: O-antigen ligase family protein [Chlamydiae bacterium]|nr:O-antigen ligase family protein [Chlamydiota bacterium]